MQSNRSLLTLAASALLFSGSVLAQGPDGKALYTAKMCMTCHGPDGATPTAPMYPKLTGLAEDYMTAQMTAIQSGARANGASAAMKAITATVKPEEFAAIAKWLASQPAIAKGGVDKAAPGAKLFAEKGCAACHGEDANTPVSNAENGNVPKLAGQGNVYSLNQMKDIRDGKRASADSAKMKAKVEGLTDADFTTLSAWLAAVK